MLVDEVHSKLKLRFSVRLSFLGPFFSPSA